jgi:general secretion pathway protein D
MKPLSTKTALRTLISLTFFAFGAVSEAAPMFLGVNPGTAVQGNSFQVDVAVTNASDLYAFQFDLGFDPTLLHATGVSEGSFLPGAGATFMVPGLIDNTSGSITFISDALVGFVAGASGDGLLMTIDFQALAPGLSALTLLNPLFLDSTLADTTGDLTVVNGSVSIAPGVPPTIPEPVSWMLVITALAAACMGGRSRSQN